MMNLKRWIFEIIVLSLVFATMGYAAHETKFSGLQVTDLTASRAVQTDASKNLESSAVTNTELGYLNGVTGTTGTGDMALGTSPEFSTSILPDSSGGATIGSPGNEWSDFFIADDKKIYLGSDQDAYLTYDSTNDVVYLHGKALAATVAQTYGVTWDEAVGEDTYTRTGALAGYSTGSSPGNDVLPIQAAMRRCVMNDSGEVLYYLDPDDSTLKEGGGAADLTGGDGQVMVQIPAFYYKYSYSGTTHSWSISRAPLEGYSLHPAFQKNGEMVEYRYIGAYEGSMYDDSAGAMVADADIENDMYAADDLLCSISGEYPKTNETRDEFRSMAAERGTGWRQLDYYLASAVQLLYLIEYADFDSQTTIGNGRTKFSDGSWEAANQGNGMYIGQCGYSNDDGNATNATDRGSTLDISAIDTSDADYHDYMTYRGIENFFGNVWKWVDGINVHNYDDDAGTAYSRVWVSNNDSNFADDTSTDYYQVADIWEDDGYPGTLEQVPDGFLPAGSGGSDSTDICDYYYTYFNDLTPAFDDWRVAILGGHAKYASRAGFFYWTLYIASGTATVYFSGRLCF